MTKKGLMITSETAVMTDISDYDSLKVVSHVIGHSDKEKDKWALIIIQ